MVESSSDLFEADEYGALLIGQSCKGTAVYLDSIYDDMEKM